MKIYDLSVPITSDTFIFPGDPAFQIKVIQSLAHGDKYNLCSLHLNNHMGTHIDFPAHVIKDGKTSSHFPIETFIGSGIILECADGKISKDFVLQQRHKLLGNQFVFFKTSCLDANSSIFIEEAAIEELVQQKVKIVGVDSLSIDPIEATNLPVHHALLSQDVLIVEGLNLKNVPAGQGEVIIAPLNIPNMDGLPARVIIKM